MAATRLSDVIDVTVFRDLPAVNSPEKTAFWQSGVVATSDLFSELADAPGKTAELPFWKDIDASVEANVSSDDPAALATPQKVEQGEQIARKQMINQGWSAANLATDLAMGADALQHVRNRVDAYFARQYQRRLLAAAQGVMADNTANDAGDMVHDIASESVAGQSSATRFSRGAFIDASYTMGDMVDGVVAMAVHSSIMKQIAEQGDAEDVVDADGNLVYRAYMGRRLIVDDQMTTLAGATDGFKYVSILFGGGAFGYGEGNPPVPVEVDSDPRGGNGAGVQELWVRKKTIIHPLGFQNTGTPVGDSFTIAELKAATTWDRVVDRKNAPFAFLVSN